jgi:hypothetical protein
VEQEEYEMRPLYIFDLDGTLADIAHRRHHVMGDNHDWPAFYAECDKDTPNWPVLFTLDALSRHADVWIWSGRSDEVRDKTLDWLYKNTMFDPEQIARILLMRPAGDYTPDDQLKKTWYEALSEIDKRRIVAVFDDRDRMVAMWRSLGVACFQVAPGGF